MPPAWLAYLALAVAPLLLGRRLVDQPLPALAAWTVATTAATHAAFFGAGRYGVVTFAILGALAGGCLPPRRRAEQAAVLTPKAKACDTALEGDPAHAAD
jgi:hypothetical protein